MQVKKVLYPTIDLQPGDRVIVSPLNHYNLIDDRKSQIMYIEFVKEHPYYIELDVHFKNFLGQECFVKRTGFTKADLFCGAVRIRRDDGAGVASPFLGCSDSIIYEVTTRKEEYYEKTVESESYAL